MVEALFVAGVHQLKCATPLEASLAVECAARLGCRLDLLVAYPLARPGVEAILELARRAPKHVELSLLADDPEHAQELNSQCAGTVGTVAPLSTAAAPPFTPMAAAAAENSPTISSTTQPSASEIWSTRPASIVPMHASPRPTLPSTCSGSERGTSMYTLLIAPTKLFAS